MEELDIRKEVINATKEHFQSHINKHRVNIECLLYKVVAIPEHTDVIDAVEKEVEIMASYQDKLEIMEKYFSE